MTGIPWTNIFVCVRARVCVCVSVCYVCIYIISKIDMGSNFDRHQRKNKAFFAERLPSSVVMMNNNGGVDMIKIQSAISNQLDISPGESPATLPPTKVMVSEQLSELLNHNGSSSYIIRNEECQNHDSPTWLAHEDKWANCFGKGNVNLPKWCCNL